MNVPPPRFDNRKATVLVSGKLRSFTNRSGGQMAGEFEKILSDKISRRDLVKKAAWAPGVS